MEQTLKDKLEKNGKNVNRCRRYYRFSQCVSTIFRCRETSIYVFNRGSFDVPNTDVERKERKKKKKKWKKKERKNVFCLEGLRLRPTTVITKRERGLCEARVRSECPGALVYTCVCVRARAYIYISPYISNNFLRLEALEYASTNRLD